MSERHIIRPCPKCRSRNIGIRYLPETDLIAQRCRTCGYTWRSEPFDRQTPIPDTKKETPS